MKFVFKRTGTIVENYPIETSEIVRDANGNIIEEYRMWDRDVYGNETEEIDRHSPLADQRFVYLVDFMTALETQVQYAAFHDQYVKTATGIAVPYWQSAQDGSYIMVKDEDDQQKIMTNIVAFVHDRDALGTYRKEEEALTTPVNAKGRYYNTFWHLDNLYFNDLSENGIVFTLN